MNLTLAEKIEKSQDMANKVWARAQALEDRKKSGEKRLKSFSILARIFLYPRFKRIRNIINRRANERGANVWMAIGMIRTVNKMKRRQRENLTRSLQKD